jgi:hypothetical protein
MRQQASGAPVPGPVRSADSTSMSKASRYPADVIRLSACTYTCSTGSDAQGDIRTLSGERDYRLASHASPDHGTEDISFRVGGSSVRRAQVASKVGRSCVEDFLGRHLGPIAVDENFYVLSLHARLRRPAILIVAARYSRPRLLEGFIPGMKRVVPQAVVAVMCLDGHQEQHHADRGDHAEINVEEMLVLHGPTFRM